MPLETIEVSGGRAWAIWKMTETENELQALLPYRESVPPATTHPQKRIEYLTGRLLTCELTKKLELNYQGIVKDDFGKPFLKGHSHHISLSHSFPYVAVIIDADHPVGIDLEQPKEKLLKIASRVLSPSEAADAGDDVVKHCIYWCAKEAMIKIYGKKDLTLAEHLLISPFSRAEEGNIIGRLIVDGISSVLTLYYLVTSQFVMVFNTRTKPGEGR